MEFTRRLNALLMKLFGGERVLPVLLLSNLGSSLVEFGEWTRDCSLGHVGKEGPHLTMMGASREFSRAAVPVWGFHEVGRGAQGASRVAPGKLGFNGRGEGNASLLSSQGRVSGLKMR